MYIEFTQQYRDIITDKFKSWREMGEQSHYCDVNEFCYSANPEEIINNDYSLVTSKYIKFNYSATNNNNMEELYSLINEYNDLLNNEQNSQNEVLMALKELKNGVNL